MTTIAFKASRARIETRTRSHDLEVDMDRNQMLELLAAIQNRVGYEIWDDMVARLDPDAPPRTEAFASDGSAIA